MDLRRFVVSLPGIVLTGACFAAAADLAPETAETPASSSAPASVAADSRGLTAAIDGLIVARWQATGTRPAPAASDAEFLRRIYLDLTGTIPSAFEARDFLDDSAADKRSRLVERLLASPAYSAHMASTWRELLLPEVASNSLIQFLASDFDPWLRKKFAENAAYDAIVREILTVSVTPGQNPRGLPIGQGPPTPFAFIAAKDGKPENLAASTSRIFLGVRLECAQCHDHPFARWKRDQFWSFAAFFAGVERTNQGNALFQAREVADRRELAIPGTERVAQAGFLDGSEPEWRPRVSARVVLADWMTAADNPYFSRAVVNRVWAQFLGTGLVDPVDELGVENAPSHPELLDALSGGFVAAGYDFQFLIRAIVASRPYGLATRGDSPAPEDPRLFARMPTRGMSPMQHYASLVQAAGLRREPEQGPGILGVNSPRTEFLDKFSAQDEKATEHQTSILQVLTLMNGRLMARATSLEQGGTLPAVAAAHFLDTSGKIEALYLAALSRRPRPEELERLIAYVDRGGPTLNPRHALADVFWALLNGAEFSLIH